MSINLNYNMSTTAITTGEAFTLLGAYTSNSLREELVQTIAEREEEIRNHKH